MAKTVTMPHITGKVRRVPNWAEVEESNILAGPGLMVIGKNVRNQAIASSTLID
jgi:hypothetical protein